ncbi:hypothetical protein [Phycicoccus sonneratiae]|uniref:Uncharacterized protein n=1 Tax=Phycicoccus sonneratiae TaxID=2807628 RepID=A0ABS2CMM7_9MICO|nr:hypothetical protein [Phycicoccus sonneraticus]MBM6401078.1 hypothetical protein [Phycicoccus sonneraticus]
MTSGADHPTAPLEPPSGWAESPRPPRTVRLTQAQAIAVRAAVSSALRPVVVASLVLALAAGVAVGWAVGPATGCVVGLLLAVVLGGRVVTAILRIRRPVVPGAERATGYDVSGSFVVAGAGARPMGRGWARRAVRRDGVVRLHPRRARAGVVVVVGDLVTVDDEDFLLGHPARTGPARETVVDARLRRDVRRHALRQLLGVRVVLAGVLLAAADLALTRAAPWTWQVGLTLASLVLFVLLVAGCLAAVVATEYPDGRTLRSFVADDVLHLEAGLMLARTAPLEALRAGSRRGRLVRFPGGGLQRACPVDLVPAEAGAPAS